MVVTTEYLLQYIYIGFTLLRNVTRKKPHVLVASRPENEIPFKDRYLHNT